MVRTFGCGQHWLNFTSEWHLFFGFDGTLPCTRDEPRGCLTHKKEMVSHLKLKFIVSDRKSSRSSLIQHRHFDNLSKVARSGKEDWKSPKSRPSRVYSLCLCLKHTENLQEQPLLEVFWNLSSYLDWRRAQADRNENHLGKCWQGSLRPCGSLCLDWDERWRQGQLQGMKEIRGQEAVCISAGNFSNLEFQNGWERWN